MGAEGNESYVVRTAKLKCSKSDTPSRLDLPQCHGIYLRKKPQMNIMDYTPIQNITSFGRCKATRGQCVPEVQQPWSKGKDDVLINGSPALLNTSVNYCLHGGEITITDDGQE